MHTQVRLFIKTAIGFLAIGLLLGACIMVQRELGNGSVSPYLTSAHTHAIFVGFVMMMILGVALWLFPRPDRTDSRYRPSVATAAYWMLTVGTVCRIAGELLRMVEGGSWLRWSIVLAGLFQIAGMLAFFATMWSRIRPLGSRNREASGERF